MLQIARFRADLIYFCQIGDDSPLEKALALKQPTYLSAALIVFNLPSQVCAAQFSLWLTVPLSALYIHMNFAVASNWIAWHPSQIVVVWCAIRHCSAGPC